VYGYIRKQPVANYGSRRVSPGSCACRAGLGLLRPSKFYILNQNQQGRDNPEIVPPLFGHETI